MSQKCYERHKIALYNIHTYIHILPFSLLVLEQGDRQILLLEPSLYQFRRLSEGWLIISCSDTICRQHIQSPVVATLT